MSTVRQYFIYTAVGLIALFGMFLASTAYLQAVTYAETARGVDAYLVTKSQTVTTDDHFTAAIMITNDGTPLNAMEAEVLFDPELFAVANFTFGSSLCEERLIIDRVIDNEAGRVHMSCGTIEPFTGNATVFGTITIRPQKPGMSELTFGEETHVHVHDGLGTEIVRDTYDATIVTGAGT